ncbi:myb-like DNA-binding protein FlbD [Fusarium austroafricanum]|uniref:Myb-like DNA-binding protein FlbD n=1 Tax=Fusarium austroafricanum TaxID=2364996 RepID=A0A8H4NW62_9HYPO|nr:myb-like DNA-binding protein FlbD [Fusarium austroafricanum]
MNNNNYPHRRGPWSQSEDALLMDLVHQHGALNWVRIASQLNSRTPKQCRERYHQNLKPSLNHEPITPEEGLMIERLVGEIGKRWAEIARRLNGRSDNAVKNWWNGSQNRRRRSDRRRAVQGHDDYYPVNRPGLTISTPNLPVPGTQLSPLTGPVVRHPMNQWIDAPLPSPCSSESAESEIGSNYTTSPSHQAMHLSMPVELPPLRSPHNPGNVDPRLPSLDRLAPSSYTDRPECQPRLAPFAPQAQLPTAPNSPVQQQSQSRRGQDSRMHLSTLMD